MSTHYADNYDELAKPVIRPDGEVGKPDGETFYSDDYEELTGRERDGSTRDGGDKTVTVTKVVTAPKAAPAKSTAAETK